MRGGLTHIQFQRYERAILNFSVAINLVPRHVDAYYHRGLSCFRLGNYEKAINDFAQVIVHATNSALKKLAQREKDNALSFLQQTRDVQTVTLRG